MGPKVNRLEVEKVEASVNDASASGAERPAGKRRLTEGEFARNYWFEPALLRVVGHHASVMQCEIVGPVVP